MSLNARLLVIWIIGFAITLGGCVVTAHDLAGVSGVILGAMLQGFALGFHLAARDIKRALAPPPSSGGGEEGMGTRGYRF